VGPRGGGTTVCPPGNPHKRRRKRRRREEWLQFISHASISCVLLAELNLMHL